MNCAFCGEYFTGRKRKYCNKACCLRAHGVNPNYKPEANCLVCGKQLTKGQKKYCSMTCDGKAYHRRKGGVSLEEWREKLKARPSREEKEKKQRDLLSDRIVKRNIYIALNRKVKGSIRYRDITPEMIIQKRAQILAWRQRIANPPLKPQKVKTYRACIVCGNVFEVKGKSPVCGDECRKADGRNKYYADRDAILKKLRDEYEPKPKTEQICKQCGTTFMGHDGDALCSDICTRRAKQARKAKKRAEKAGVYYEPVDFIRVFKRDGWRCQICKKKLNPKHRGTMRDDAPELDHIIPWAQGGEHSYRNTQCACRKCNEEKGAVARGQIRLFG